MAVDVDDIFAQLEALSQSQPTSAPAVPLLSGDATASVTDVEVTLPFHVVQRGTTGDLSLSASDAGWTESIIRNEDGTTSDKSRTIPATINTRLPLIHAAPANSNSTSLFPSPAEWATSQLSLDSHYGPNVDTKRLMSYQRAHLDHIIHKFQQTVPISTSLLPISLPHLRYDLVRSSDGRVTGYRTVECGIEHTQTATTSTSYKRIPTTIGTTNFTRGSGGQMPFRPGGLDDDDDLDNSSSSATTTTTSSTPAPDRASLFPWENTDIDRATLTSLLHHHAPGLSHGLDDVDTTTDISLYISTINGAPPVDHVDVAAQVEARRQQQQMKLQQKQIVKNSTWEDEDVQLGGEEKKQANVTTSTSTSSTTTTIKESLPVSAFLSDASLDPSSMSADERALLDTLADVTSRGSKRVISEWCVQQRMPASAIAEFHTTIPNPAIRFPFELDTFQKEAVLHLERGECVFVSAHTSAGKTVVAEYAIALSAKHLTRAIYTSPIKTLSNQKFREFRKTFGESSVGIMTGDVSINPEASCLILTTEILRSMLYRGADLIRDIEWVIFDEVHYVNDLERGVVWEEVIIMLPAHINIILLSATVPNTAEFADWVGRTKRKKIYVISTEKRPVPLQHFLWCKNKLWNIVDASGRFNAVTYKEAKTEATGRDESKEKKKPVVLGQGNQQMQPYRKATHRSVKQTWTTIVNYLQTRALLPVAVFSFSKKMCEECASALSTMDLTTGVEKSEIHVFVNDALQRLAAVDRTLPQVQRVRDLVRRGIGIHHAGMLPILKEVVELVFQRGLVKVLFATETFAMGVNMPTKTVIFNGLRKNDGVNFRPLHPGEYTQMSGRAGRRGLDTFGVVVIHCRNDEVPDEATLKQMILGRPTRLESRFRLTYNMILNLLRQEDIKVEDMIRRSFGESAQQKQLPEHKLALRRGEQQLQQMNHAVECRYGTPEAIREYFNLSESLSSLNTALLSSILSNSKLTSKYLCIGRAMVINKYNLKYSISVLVKITSSALTVLTLCPPGYTLPSRIASRTKEMNIHHAIVGTFTYVILELRASDIYALLDIRLDIDGSSLVLDRHPSKLTSALNELNKIRMKYSPAQQKTETAKKSILDQEPARGRGRDAPTPTTVAPWTSSIDVNRLPILDLTAEIRVSDMNLADEIAMKPVYQTQLQSHICHTCPDREAHYTIMSQQSALQQRLTTLQHMLSDDNVELMNDFEIRVAVLQQLGYVDTNRTVQLKGRVACEINTCDSLILTELIFENVLTLLSPEEICSLLSSLVFQQKDVDVEPILTQKLDEAKTRMIEITTNLAQLQVQHGMELDVTEYIKANVNIGMMQVVYEWAKGTSFSAICELTTVPEGTIVRAMMRLEETCRDVRNAARVIGDPKLYQNMTKCSELLKRDIVFAASLYVT